MQARGGSAGGRDKRGWAGHVRAVAAEEEEAEEEAASCRLGLGCRVLVQGQWQQVCLGRVRCVMRKKQERSWHFVTVCVVYW